LVVTIKGFLLEKTGVHEMAKNCPSVRIWANPSPSSKLRTEVPEFGYLLS
jgi:hypothetical protein